MRRFGLSLCLGLAGWLGSVSAYAFFDDYLPLSKAEIRKRISMQHLATLDPSQLISKLKIGQHSIKLSTSSEDELILSGQTTKQGSWTASLMSIYAMFPVEAYQADLDGNGQQDLILLKPTAGNGLAPTQHITVLSFDADGQVTPWQVEGYFATDKQGIVDFLDLNGNGRAELVFMSYGEGYWQTVLYEAQNGQWTQIHGKFAGKTYPLLTRFTIKANHKIAHPNKLKPIEPVSLATDKKVLTGYLKSYQWANVEQSEDISLLIQTDKKLIKCQPSSWHSLFRLVIDKPQQREIISLGANSKTLQARLQEIMAKQYPLKVYGQRAAEACSPEEIWVNANH